MLNTIKKGNKLSHLEKKMNLFIIYIFIFELTLMLIASILNYVNNNFYNRFQFQDFTNENKIYLASINFLSYLILLGNLIPISLVITIEVARGLQSLFILNDLNMYDVERDIKPDLYTVNINEEWGQINYILSDKTGTLTINKMDLKFLNFGFNLYDLLNINNLKFESLKNIIDLKLSKNENIEEDHSEKNRNLIYNNTDEIKYPIKYFSIDNSESIEFLNEEEFLEFNIILLLSCHDCFIKKDDNNLIYNGESPDEIAFLEKLKNLNIKLIEINEDEIKINIFEKNILIKRLGIIEFDNDRKCMSVVINFKFKNTNKNILFIKGADNSIFDKSNKNITFIESIKKNINYFSNKGLRVLLLGFKILSEQELKEFEINYNEYKISKKMQIISNWEENINIIGSTAVEDKLVPNLNKTIKNINNSGIKIWVLTGDKLETAQQIGLSCKLLENIENLFSIKNDSNLENFFNNNLNNNELKNEKYSLIIEGILLNKILEEKKYGEKFFNKVKNFKSCIFCRITPLQKALIVELVKSQKNITLAIGDGSNDVSMIQKADVGVGIFGNEGRQAVNNSDFSLPNFTDLNSLWFNHGRLNYLRMSKTILYFFYKNIVFVIPGFFSGFNGQHIFDDFYPSMYNTIITAFPLAFRVLMEQNILDYKIKYNNNRLKFINYFDLSNKNKSIIVYPKIQYLFPFLYGIGNKSKILTNKIFLVMFLFSIFESIFLFFISIYSFYNYEYNRIICSFCLITVIVINVSIKLTFETNFIWFGHIAIALLPSIGIFLIFIFLFQDFNTFDYFTTNFYIKNLTFYLVLILGILFFISINFTNKIINLYLFPTEVKIVDEFIKKESENKNGLLKLIKKNESKYKFYSNYINRY